MENKVIAKEYVDKNYIKKKKVQKAIKKVTGEGIRVYTCWEILRILEEIEENEEED